MIHGSAYNDLYRQVVLVYTVGIEDRFYCGG